MVHVIRVSRLLVNYFRKVACSYTTTQVVGQAAPSRAKALMAFGLFHAAVLDFTFSVENDRVHAALEFIEEGLVRRSLRLRDCTLDQTPARGRHEATHFSGT
jgi:hypothetical protein